MGRNYHLDPGYVTIPEAEELIEAEKMKLFHIDLSSDYNDVNKISELPMIDHQTARKLYYYLKTLSFHEIISPEIYQNAERELMLRIKVCRITPV
jgi:hypothetical protein